MSDPENTPRDAFGSKLGFILAAAGSAVGLGNIWKFPYITGLNGGGAFVLVYLLCIVLVGLPIMVAEIMIGRAAQRQPVAAFHRLHGGKTPWAGIGWLGVVAGFVILSFYVVVAGWAADATFRSVANATKGIHQEAEAQAIVYRANEDLDAMRSSLAERDAKRELKPIERDIKAETTKRNWERHQEFNAAIAAAATRAEEADASLVATARERLFLKADVKEAVATCSALQARIDTEYARLLAEAKTRWDGVPEPKLLDEAENLKRRTIIAEKVSSGFNALASDGITSSFWAALILMVTILIVIGGVSSGIEAACKVLMPLLIGIILFMVVYGATTPGFGPALEFVFKPDFGRLTGEAVLEALGHAFFTLSLGMGAMITYGSYQRSGSGELFGQSVTIAGLDTVIALLACMMMFPILFAFDQEPGAGPGLVFVSMPLAFAEIGGFGMILAILFFGLLVFAALTSSVSLLEVVCSYFIDEKGWPRKKAALVIGAVIFVFAIPTAFHADGGGLFKSWNEGHGKSFFDSMDHLASNWLLPLGGLLISIYAGWIMPKRIRDAEMHDVGAGIILGWLFLVRFIAPALVLLVLANKIELIDIGELLKG